MDDPSPGHRMLLVLGTEVGEGSVQFIRLVLVGTSISPFFPGVFAFPNHANLKHVGGAPVLHACGRVELLLRSPRLLCLRAGGSGSITAFPELEFSYPKENGHQA